MSFLNSFIHGDALASMLLEGHNPSARDKLSESDVDAMRQKLQTSETLLAYAVGRIVGAGQGVWLLTDQAVVLRNSGHKGAERLVLNQVSHFESVRGRFGHVVRLKAQGRALSLYGVDRELAAAMYSAFAGLGVPSSHEDKEARSWFWRDPATPNWAQDGLIDAKRRLSLA
jgi:hypothetical protein